MRLIYKVKEIRVCGGMIMGFKKKDNKKSLHC